MRSPVLFRGRPYLHYAGHYYPAEESCADEFLHEALASVSRTQDSKTRMIIVPNGSYRICGKIMAAAYSQLCPETIKRIFVFGRTRSFVPYVGALTTTDYLNTPLGKLLVDQEVNAELLKTGDFIHLDLPTDRKERFIEIQLPFIAKLMENRKGLFKVVPVYIGSLAHEQQVVMARRFQSYVKDSGNAFVFSASLCHWGDIYGYNQTLADSPSIQKSIEATDALILEQLKKLNFKCFDNALLDTKATVYDRQIIGICILMIRQLLNDEMYRLLKLDETNAATADHSIAEFKLMGQAWSYPEVTANDSCISYFAAAITTDSTKYSPEEPTERSPLNKLS